jgi:four helix bundle protein
MSKIEKFEDLECWKTSRELVKQTYAICLIGTLSKDFGTQDQIKRASISVMNNIAEGFGRYSRKEFIRFLDFSQSSALEVKSMLYAISDVHNSDLEKIKELHEITDKARFQILGLIKYLKNNPK